MTASSVPHQTSHAVSRSSVSKFQRCKRDSYFVLGEKPLRSHFDESNSDFFSPVQELSFTCVCVCMKEIHFNAMHYTVYLAHHALQRWPSCFSHNALRVNHPWKFQIFFKNCHPHFVLFLSNILWKIRDYSCTRKHSAPELVLCAMLSVYT